MKKTNNKGFSLVELIIVIAIMAILAGAIAPALIRYIDKSRRSNDVSSCKTIKTAIETALGNESVYELLTQPSTGDFVYIYITPGEKMGETTTSTGAEKAITFKNACTDAKINGKTNPEVVKIAKNEIGTNIGEKSPKLKFKKNAAEKKNSAVPTEYVGVVSKNGTVYVLISTSDAGTLTVEAGTDGGIKEPGKDAGFIICPNVCDEYQ